MKKQHLSFILIAVLLIACKKEEINNEDLPQEPTTPKLVFKIKLDPNQPRLDNFGQPATLPPNHGAQSPFFNNISTHTIKTESLTVNANKLQGYWAWETHPNQLVQAPLVSSGEAPGTTVPNPLSATSPIPQGSCLVTGQFPSNLVITGNETQDIVVELSFSTNNSFEWYDALQNNIFEPLDGDSVVDMGIRGLVPTVLQ